MAYRLVKDYVSRDLVEALEQLLHGAKSGDVTGIAFGAVLKRQRYITNVAGLCFTNPTFTRGVICCLDDELQGMINGRDPNETR
jgi:hypothetical protein